MRLRSIGGLTVRVTAIAAGAAAQTIAGPSSSQTPYVVPSAKGWITADIISTGDRTADGRYAMAGIPDGLGALPGKIEGGQLIADPAYVTVFMNHEIPSGSGVVRAHGQPGAFVSQS